MFRTTDRNCQRQRFIELQNPIELDRACGSDLLFFVLDPSAAAEFFLVDNILEIHEKIKSGDSFFVYAAIILQSFAAWG